MCPVLCRVDDGSRASFEGFAARFDAAVRLLFVRQYRQPPNPTANDRETDRGRLSPSSKQMVAMETSKRAGCHGIRQEESVPSFESKTKKNCVFLHRLKLAKVLKLFSVASASSRS